MGTRADFYVGRGEHAEWLGSIAWDGHWGTVLDELGLAGKDYPDPDAGMTEAAWRELVADYLGGRDDGTLAGEHGWPWPWNDSHTTDRSYTWDGGVVYCSQWGHAWVPLPTALACITGEWSEEKCDACPVPDNCEGPKEPMPDMSARREMAAGTPRDSIMVLKC